MLETFIEFTFEAAHSIPPYSKLHGHSFAAVVYMSGARDPVFGWSHNLYDVAAAIEGTRLRVDHAYLNDINGLEVPSLENITVWLWGQLDPLIPGLERIVLRRGLHGAGEGCSYSARAAPGAVPSPPANP
jgi:6-pyruvoyltetrahydropterin/6-carboxytetrahydropterin synthase